ncbi:MAG: TOBE domain-containing protein, partial [Nocardioidaceae bacterium]
GASVGDYVIPLERGTLSKAEGRSLKVGVRPEAWRIVDDTEPGLPVEVVVVEELGADAFLYGSTKTDVGVSELVARIDARRPPQKGSTLRLAADAARVLVFDADSGERLTG